VSGGEPAPDTPQGASVGPRANPAALGIPEAASLLSGAGGGRVTQEMIAADLADGAPANGDGTINIVHYAAWLNYRLKQRDGD